VAIRLTITNSSGISRDVTPYDIRLLQECNEPASLSCKFLSNLSVYADESSAANPVQLEAGVVLDRHGVQEFEGNVKTKTTTKLGGGWWEIELTCLDKLAQGKSCRASQSGSDTWEYSTPTAAITATDLMPSAQNILSPFNRYVTAFLPTVDSGHAAPNFQLAEWDNASAVWLALAEYNSTPLSQTVYTSYIDSGAYPTATLTEDSPVAGQTTITIDITSLANIPHEFIVGEKILAADANGSANYRAYTLLSNDGGIGTTLTLVLEGTGLPVDTGVSIISPLTIKLSTTGGGLSFGGWLLIDDEIMWYDGYDIDAAGIYAARSLARNSRCFEMTLSDGGKHYLINEYSAVKSGANVLITGGTQYDIAISQNSLFPPGATVELFNSSASLGNFTVATSTWTAATDTCTITTVEALPAAVDEIHTLNRAINIYPQKIAPGELTFEGYNATDGYNLVADKQYEVNFANGEIQTTLQPTNLGATYDSGTTAIVPASKWRVGYSYYDELNANALTVADAVRATCQAAQTLKTHAVGESTTEGGWGLSVSPDAIAVSGLSERISKFSSAEPQLLFEWLDDFLNDLGYLGSDATIAEYHWSSQDSQFVVKKLVQETVAATYRVITNVTHDSVIDEVYTAVLLNYEVPAARNYVGSYFWAPDDSVYDNPGGTCNGVEPVRAGVLIKEEAGGDGWKNLGFSASPEESHKLFPMRYVLDGLKSTGYGLEYGTNPGTDAPENSYIYFTWFNEPGHYSGVACAQELIGHVKAIVDVRKEADSGTYSGDFSLDIQVVGITAFTSPSLSDALGTDLAPVFAAANVVDLPGLRVRYQGDQDLRGIAEVVLEADNLNIALAAVCVKYNAASFEPGSTDNTFCRLKEFVVESPTRRSVFVRISDDPDSGDSRTMYAPLTHAKLVNDTYKTLEIDNGDILYDGAAISLARSILLQRLVLEDSREYELKLQSTDTVPALAKTYRILAGDEDFTGVVLARQYDLVEGVETVSVVLRDFTAPIIT
jgi:hypothetical protein